MSGAASGLLWYVGRGTGLTAYALLALSLAFGIALGRRWYSPRWPRMVVDGLHRWLTTVFYVFLGVHVITMLVDPFTHFTLADVTVPFVSNYRPIWLSLGIIAAELGVAAGVSVWIRHRIGYRTWHLMHMAVYPMFVLALLHGLGTGTDTRSVWADGVYVGGFVLVAGASLWRLVGHPVWQRRLLAACTLLALTVTTWAWVGPYQPGWAKAAGTPKKLLAGGTHAKRRRAVAPVAAIAKLPDTLRERISGRTLVGDGEQRVLLRGSGSGSMRMDVAIRLSATSTRYQGQIQLRTADRQPICAGSISGFELNRLSGRCNGYGRDVRLRVSLHRLDVLGFSGRLVGVRGRRT